MRGLTQVAVSSEEEALSQFFIGQQGRSSARHVLNAASSRSHALFSIGLEMRTSEDASERAVVSCECMHVRMRARMRLACCSFLSKS